MKPQFSCKKCAMKQSYFSVVYVSSNRSPLDYIAYFNPSCAVFRHATVPLIFLNQSWKTYKWLNLMLDFILAGVGLNSQKY